MELSVSISGVRRHLVHLEEEKKRAQALERELQRCGRKAAELQLPAAEQIQKSIADVRRLKDGIVRRMELLDELCCELNELKRNTRTALEQVELPGPC